jgi:type IV pilus assembly protein PilA
MNGEVRRRDGGFTLIELMVVILIIGILVAIALPTYLGARQRAFDRQAQSDIRTALAASLSYFTINGSYSGYTSGVATQAEPALVWLDASQPDLKQIDIQVANATDLLLVAKSGSKTFFCLSQEAGNPLTNRGRSLDFNQVDTVPECTGGW